jgi:hypothetical protein
MWMSKLRESSAAPSVASSPIVDKRQSAGNRTGKHAPSYHLSNGRDRDDEDRLADGSIWMEGPDHSIQGTTAALSYFSKSTRQSLDSTHNGRSSNSSSNSNSNLGFSHSQDHSFPFGTGQPRIEATAPRLLTSELIDRRQLIREEKRKAAEEAERQRLLAEKSRKALLKEKALRSNSGPLPGRRGELPNSITPLPDNNNHHQSFRGNNTNAQNGGGDMDHSRFSYHKRVIEKYNLRPEIGGVNLAEIAGTAYAEYSSKHLSRRGNYVVSPFQDDNRGSSNYRPRNELDIYRDLEREFKEYDDSNLNSFKFIQR